MPIGHDFLVTWSIVLLSFPLLCRLLVFSEHVLVACLGASWNQLKLKPVAFTCTHLGSPAAGWVLVVEGNPGLIQRLEFLEIDTWFLSGGIDLLLMRPVRPTQKSISQCHQTKFWLCPSEFNWLHPFSDVVQSLTNFCSIPLNQVYLPAPILDYLQVVAPSCTKFCVWLIWFFQIIDHGWKSSSVKWLTSEFPS